MSHAPPSSPSPPLQLTVLVPLPPLLSLFAPHVRGGEEEEAQDEEEAVLAVQSPPSLVRPITVIGEEGAEGHREDDVHCIKDHHQLLYEQMAMLLAEKEAEIVRLRLELEAVHNNVSSSNKELSTTTASSSLCAKCQEHHRHGAHNASSVSSFKSSREHPPHSVMGDVDSNRLHHNKENKLNMRRKMSAREMHHFKAD